MNRSFFFFFGLCVAVVFPAPNPGNGRALPKEFLDSLTAIKDAFLQNWTSEVRDSKNVLIFPVAVAQEFVLEKLFRLPDSSPEKAQMITALRLDTQSPIVLDLSLFPAAAAFEELAIRTFYNDTPPEMNNTIDDSTHFSYMAFKHWSKIHQDPAAAARRRALHGPLVTTAAIRIHQIQSENFTWSERINFRVSEKQTIAAEGLRNVGIYDYAEFNYPKFNNCLAGALRLQVSDELSIVFVIARNASDAQCNSSENLLEIFRDVHLDTTSFKSQRMFVTIPTLHVSTIVVPLNKLTQLGLLTPEPYAFNTIPKFAENYESAALIFDPEIPTDAPIPGISADTPQFQADRPFLVAVLQKENPVPVLLGLIQKPEL